MNKSMFLIFFIFFIVMNANASVELKSTLNNLKDNFELPGMSARFYQDQKLVESANVGIRKVGYSTPIQKNDKFHLGSCAKSMTATIAAIAVERGYLKWDSLLTELLPNISIHKNYENVTFDMLLAHRSGLQRDTENFEAGWLYNVLESGLYTPTQARELVAKKLLVKKAIYVPGSKYSYSNIGYMIAGYIIEKQFSLSFEKIVETHLFNPLKMKTCGFGPTSISSNLYPEQPWGHKLINDIITPVHDDNPPAFAPAGTIHCSMDDWARYLKMHLDGHNKRSNFLKKESFKKLYTLYPAPESDYTYGGWVKTKRSWANGYALTHGGTNTYNMARVWIAPQKEAIFMAATNIMTNASPAINSAVVDILNRKMPVHIEVNNPNSRTQKAKKLLQKILKDKRIFPYLISRKVVIESDVISHSHPITLNTKYINEPNLFLSVFLHEQFHHYLDFKQDEWKKFIEWTKREFPNVPIYPNGGARDELSTRSHLLVNFLEYRALSQFIGEEQAKLELLKFKHYKWIYKTMLENLSLIEEKIKEFEI